MLSQPGVQEGFVADSVQSWHDDVGGRHLVRFHFNLRHLGLPWRPLSADGHLHPENGRRSLWDPHTTSLTDSLVFTQNATCIFICFPFVPHKTKVGTFL